MRRRGASRREEGGREGRTGERETDWQGRLAGDWDFPHSSATTAEPPPLGSSCGSPWGLLGTEWGAADCGVWQERVGGAGSQPPLGRIPG